ncbi:septum formation initiator family protein [Naumannella halotolerans]|uniref:Cell division protein FtsB n=1 Tax=Naumannella halotolerans TaxID=993414 RepID=A0A4R7J849_9ACTN|nr:septum formation initiator family protein [Naumannella halotolerans]TDT32539.1 cell division protein FtsB [Naumannella halotolerans]
MGVAQATKSRPAGRPVSSGPTRTRVGRRGTSSTSTRPGARGAAATPPAKSPQKQKRAAWLTLPGGVGVTRRAIALVMVVLMLGISYANSVRIYLNQDAEIAALQQEAEQRQLAIDDLNYELSRWQDENYVRAMARDRLGWVVPGEVGFRVIDAEGNPIGSSLDRQAQVPAAEAEPKVPWWSRLENGIAAADRPVEAEPEPSADPADEEPLTADGEAPKEVVEPAEGTG